MVQEAKPSCRGKWYLPAGRMERDESIVVSEGSDTTRKWRTRFRNHGNHVISVVISL